MLRNTVIASVVGFVAILAVLLTLTLRPEAEQQPVMQAESGQSAAADVEGAAVLTQRPDCPAPQMEGIELPCLGGEIVDGEQTPAAQATVVNLWAWWCEPCRTELPLFDQLALEHPEYAIVGVHADKAATNGAALLEELGVGMASYQDDSNLFAGTLGLPQVVPITVVFAPDGTLKGYLPKSFTSYQELEDALAEMVNT